MTLKKKIGIAAGVVCMVAAVVLCVLLYREWTRPKIIEAPFEKLYWGITLEEAEQVLEEVGIDKIAKGGTDDYMRECELWTLTIEQAELLGYTYPGDLSISNTKKWPVHVGFANANSGGVIRLVCVQIPVEAPASEAITSLEKIEYMQNALNKEYGEPEDDAGTLWEKIDDPNWEPYYYSYVKLDTSTAVGAKEAILSYGGYGYVSRLYGGIYSDVIGPFM